MKTLSIMLVIFSVTLVQAEDEDFFSYDQIVKELSQATTSNSLPVKSVRQDPFSNVKIHGGVSFASSYVSISPENNSETITGFHSGIEATVGIDLFSRYWRAEGSVRSFGKTDIEENEMSLKEFDLKFIYNGYLASGFYYRVGGGLAARYLKFSELQTNDVETSAAGETFVTKEYTTPSSLLLVGIGGDFGKRFSVGFEVSYRGAMIDETIDKSAFDAALRLDAHF